MSKCFDCGQEYGTLGPDLHQCPSDVNRKSFTKCEKCLAYHTGNHKCFGLMKHLVDNLERFKKRNKIS